MQGRTHLSIAGPTVKDTRSCIPIDTARLEMTPGYVAPGSLSRRESRKDLWARLLLDTTTTTLHYVNLHSSNAARPMKMMKMLVFDRTRLSLLFWHFCTPVHIYSLF